MAKIILCLGNEISEDPHIAAIEKHVKALDSDAKVVRLDPEIDSNFIELNIANTSKKTPPSCFVIVDGERIPAESITSVWYCWNPVGQRAETLQEYIAKDFASSEWGRVICSLESYLSHARWVNRLDALSLANRKPYQLLLAQQVGLTVPKTVITNNPTAVEKLFDQANNERVIFKTMGRLFIPPDKQVFTVEIPRELPSRSSHSITKCPAIFQELVERKADLRITVVGREVFAVRIDSQAIEEDVGRLDWRRHQDRNELFSETQIPESFKNRLLEFHEKAGLVFAAYDFLELDDDFIFLESNPCRAAWLWLEESLNLKITEHIARYLLGIE